MEQMNITFAQYNVDALSGDNVSIQATIDGITMSVPLDPANRHYAGIIKATAYDGSIWGDSVPEPMATIAAEWLFNKQLQDYTQAVARLAQYQVALGREEVTEEVTFGELTDTIIVESAIAPVNPTVLTINDDGEEVEIENPLITQDNTERAAAQEVIDNTPEEVIDHYNANL